MRATSVLIPKYFFRGTVRWRVRRFFDSEEHLSQYFRTVYEDSTGDIVEKPGERQRGSVANQFVDVMIKDLLVLWNYASYTFKARSKPDALLEFNDPDDKIRAIQQAARTVIRVSRSQPG